MLLRSNSPPEGQYMSCLVIGDSVIFGGRSHSRLEDPRHSRHGNCSSHNKKRKQRCPNFFASKIHKSPSFLTCIRRVHLPLKILYQYNTAMSSQRLLFFGLSAFRHRNKQAQKNAASHHVKRQPSGFPCMCIFFISDRLPARKKIALHKK